MPSNTAVCPCRPSMPGATIMLTSSTKPASRKPPQICPPPTTASRLTPNCSPSMSIARDKSIQSRPVAIHEMPCSRKCSKYSSVTFSLVIQSNGCPSASPEAQRSLHVYLLLWYIHLNVRTKTEFLQCDIIFIRTELPHHQAINTTIDRSHHVNENVRFHISSFLLYYDDAKLKWHTDEWRAIIFDIRINFT